MIQPFFLQNYFLKGGKYHIKALLYQILTIRYVEARRHKTAQKLKNTLHFYLKEMSWPGEKKGGLGLDCGCSVPPEKQLDRY